MKTDSANNIKLGLFVSLGFILLVIAFFFVGNSNSFFNNDTELKARFSNVNGLQKGNNVLFCGINAGTVKSIVLINGNTIEVTLLIKKDIVRHIPINSTITIGTDGLMGNKILAITPAATEKIMVQDGDYLLVSKTADIDQMLTTLSRSNENIAVISEALKNTVVRINNSETLNLLDSKELSQNLLASIANIRKTTENTQKLTATFNGIVDNVRQGKGTAGMLLSNKAFADDLQTTLENLKNASTTINQASSELSSISVNLNKNLSAGKGPLPALLRDSILTQKISNSLDNIEKGTENFNQNMEALKHNFLFRGYFKKQEKRSKENK
ncbi:mce related protein [compost metagenome]